MGAGEHGGGRREGGERAAGHGPPRAGGVHGLPAGLGLGRASPGAVLPQRGAGRHVRRTGLPHFYYYITVSCFLAERLMTCCRFSAFLYSTEEINRRGRTSGRFTFLTR